MVHLRLRCRIRVGRRNMVMLILANIDKIALACIGVYTVLAMRYPEKL